MGVVCTKSVSRCICQSFGPPTFEHPNSEPAAVGKALACTPVRVPMIGHPVVVVDDGAAVLEPALFEPQSASLPWAEKTRWGKRPGAGAAVQYFETGALGGAGVGIHDGVHDETQDDAHKAELEGLVIGAGDRWADGVENQQQGFESHDDGAGTRGVQDGIPIAQSSQ